MLGYSEYHLPAAQIRLGHTAAVLTSDRYFPFQDYASTVEPILGKRMVKTGVRDEYGVMCHRRPVAFEFRHHLWLKGFGRAIRDFDPDIVHVHEAFTPVALQSALGKRGHRYGLVVASSMEKEVFYPQAPLRRAFYTFHRRCIAPILARHTDRFLAVSVGARDVLSSALGVPAHRIDVVPLGADDTRFIFDPGARHRIRAALSIPEEMAVAIYAGKLIPDKDVHILLRAVARMRSRREFGVLLLGNGTPEYKANLLALAAGCRAKVVMLPAVPNVDLPGYFSAADMGVWPGQSSNAVIEAALVGLPLVVNQSEATASYVGGGNGLSFMAGDENQLANCLDRLVDDESLRSRMADSGREYVGREMSWRAVAKRLLSLYDNILSASLGIAHVDT